MKRIHCAALILLSAFPFLTGAQTFWTETFNNGCTSGCLASSYTGPNGTWTLFATGSNDPLNANKWYISCAENGNGSGNCGSGCGNNATLHIGADDGFVLDPGAAYDAGGFCGVFFCVQTDMRAESPTINCTGKTNITLKFDYMEFGDNSIDDGSVYYFDGAIWNLLVNTPKTLCCGNQTCNGSIQGKWVNYSISLPASANNNPNVKIGFRWMNNDDGAGTDPSFAIDNVQLSVPGAAPNANFTASNTNICAGNCITFTDQSTGSPTTWTWSFTGGSPSSSNAQNPGTVCYNTPGTYAVSLTVTNSNGSSTLTQNTYITVNAAPTANAGSNASICNGSSTTLNASGGTGYSWAPATGLSSTTISNPLASPTTTTTYTVTVSNASGCTATASVTVTVNPLPNANAGNNVTICTGNSTQLTATGGTSYSWTPAGSLSSATVSNPNATPTTNTTYTVYVTNSNGCTDTAQVTVTVQSSLTANAGNPVSICNGSSTQLNASGGSNYSWSPATGLSSITVSNPNASPTTTTTYTVTVSSGNCSSTASVTITVNPLPTATAGSGVAICNGSSTTLNASGGTGFSWSPASGLSSTTVSNPSATPSATTIYVVTVTDANGCSDTASVTVTINQPPNATAGSNVTICNGSNTALAAGGGTTYSWAPSSSLSSSSGANVTANPTNTTTYTVFVTDANGCTDTAQVTVTVNTCAGPIPVINASSTSICDGDCITFTDASTNGPTSWSWTFQGGSPASSTQQNPGTVCFTGTGNHTVTLLVSNSNGSNSTTSTIVVNADPVATAGPSATIQVGDSVQLTSSGGGTYSWAPAAGLSCTTCQNPTATPTVTTTYTVTVSQNGCTSTATVTITVDTDHDIFIPDAFSPNGDGFNETWLVHGKGIKFIHITVYDRIGEKMFEANDISVGWDGTYKGSPMNTAVFVYYVEVGYFDDTTQSFKGDLSLVR